MPSNLTPGHAGTVYSVRYYGALGDGAALDTLAIQAAIDACHRAGGGTVWLPAGRYLTGTLYLRSYVTLYLAAQATLVGSPAPDDYASDVDTCRQQGGEALDRCLIFARQAQRVGICGEGVVDGQGEGDSFANPGSEQRPMLLRLVGCTEVRLRDVTIQAPASWATSLIDCRDVRIEDVTIHSRAKADGQGLVLDGCQDVWVRGCRIDASGDGMAVHSSEREAPCQRVMIRDCTLTAEGAGVRIGLLSRGDVRSVTVSDCCFDGCADCGIALQVCEGGELADLSFANLMMLNTPRPVFATLSSYAASRGKGATLPPIGALRRVEFRGLHASCGPQGRDGLRSFIGLLGLPANPIEDVTFSEVHFCATGGGTLVDGLRTDVPELGSKRPEHRLLGDTLPSYGVYARHVKGLVFDRVTLCTLRPEVRPAMMCDDVQGLELNGLRALNQATGPALIRLRDVRGALVRACRCLAAVKAFISAEGACRELALVGNDLRLAGKAVRRGSEVGKSDVRRRGNLTP